MMYTAEISWAPAAPFDPFAIDFGGAAVASSEDRIHAILTAEGPTPIAALEQVLARCLETIPGEFIAAEIMTIEEQDRRLYE